MPLEPYLSTTPSDFLGSPAIIRIGSTNKGVTRGGVKWDPGWEVEHIQFDGMHAPVLGMQRKFYGIAKLSFTLLDLGLAATGNQIAMVEAASSAASAGSPNVTTITPEDGGTLYDSDNVLTLLRAIWDRGAGAGINRYFCVVFPKAYVMKWAINDSGNVRDVATVDVEVCALKDMSSGTLNDAPYYFEYREALP
jgi:hypothetical protein